ncbi:MAG: HDOD domain-containing protein [Pseudomonadaceae bacterium]|nr:HDOD domain-containing protein [Pseudomonadaceae bacterium]
MALNQPLFARQPIFDAQLNVVAHELLFRGIATTGESATAEVLLSALDQSVFDVHGDGLPVFVNFPAQILLHMPLLDKSKLVVEILEDVEVTADLVEAVRALHDEGYRIALDDYIHTPEFAPLLDVADIIKLDVLAVCGDELDDLALKLRKPGRALLAEKVETHAVYEQCQLLGMDLYQGFFFAKPKLVHGAVVSADQSAVLNLLVALQDPAITPDQLEVIVLSDAVLTYRIIKLVNSAHYRRANEITSVAAAITMLGLRQVSAFASLFSLSTLDEKPTELSLYTAMRADLCQRIGAAHKLPYATENLFVLGVLSCTEAYFDQSMQALTATLPISDELKGALCERQGCLGALLDIAQSYQEGTWSDINWAQVVQYGFDTETADAAYQESLVWLAEHRQQILSAR